MKAYYRDLHPFVLWRRIEGPPRWDALFGREAPLIVELGFGNGDRLVREAAANPEIDYIGIELVWPSVKRALRRIHDNGLRNIRILQDDARTALRYAFEPNSLRHCYSLFPCPWPKDRHEKHRLFSGQFLRLVNSRLKPQAQLKVVTDDAAYRDWVLEEHKHCGFDAACDTIAAGFNTRYERKWVAQGQNEFYELRFTKQEHIDIPARGDFRMQTHRFKTFSAEGFRPQDQSDPPVSIVFKDFVFDPQRCIALQRVVVAEDGLWQDCWLEIAKKEDGSWHLYPAPGSHIVPTVGLQAALDCAAEAAKDSANRES